MLDGCMSESGNISLFILNPLYLVIPKTVLVSVEYPANGMGAYLNTFSINWATLSLLPDTVSLFEDCSCAQT